MSDQLFYGAANISSSKLGSLIYIPAVSKVEDTLKTSGPSPFRNLIALVMKKAISTSASFENLNTAFTQFNNAFRSEEASGLSIESLKTDINNDLMQWGVGIDIEVSPINPDDIVKNLLKPHIEDQKLDGQRVDISSFGQGLQRHLIYTLIKMSAKYHTPAKATKKDFNPDYTLILFEGPEAFLHPSQQDVLYRSLIDLSSEPGQQIIISTHSSLFVSKSINSIPSICKLHRQEKETKAYQIKESNLQEILSNNLVAARLSGENKDPDFDEEVRVSDEAIKYFLWLDSERSNLFFARHVLLCEGPSEKIYLDYLADREWAFLRNNRVYILDCVGKFNIHRFIHLLTELGIPHSVLFDGDNDQKNKFIDHSMWNRLINDAKTPLTKGVHQFQVDLEEFLNIEKPNSKRGDLKPINVIKKHVSGEIAMDKLEELKAIVHGITSV
ncbi:ATP-dependent nuclease [Oceanisphaera psychrotolerans]|uniref:ATP-dependent nuclease n=1 Tax=Oceanisphaera psychrotolerans TaxID=1414654 RepID=UPI002481F077|nr:TOPRIM nucleotidyl transferase/hydrolase domain-containing protein [Oceanisphaera psychrotolerans]